MTGQVAPILCLGETALAPAQGAAGEEIEGAVRRSLERLLVAAGAAALGALSFFCELVGHLFFGCGEEPSMYIDRGKVSVKRRR